MEIIQISVASPTLEYGPLLFSKLLNILNYFNMIDDNIDDYI